jgi:very-short-patch-repair endonuclease
VDAAAQADPMDILDAVKRHGGIVPSARLVRDGARAHEVAELVDHGKLVRIRRRWVATPYADRTLVQAARSGTVITCVTQARRSGLWVKDASGPMHVAARPHAGRIPRTDALIVHWHEPLVPRHPDLLVDHVENVLAHVALCLPFEDALAIWESALRKGRADARILAGLSLGRRSRALLGAARPFSDSGLESFIGPRLAWMRVRVVPQAWIDGHRVDFLLGERLVLQIDGGHHIGQQREQDNQQDAALLIRGYHVIRVSYDQVVNDWAAVQDMIMRAIAQGLHRA